MLGSEPDERLCEPVWSVPTAAVSIPAAPLDWDSGQNSSQRHHAFHWCRHCVCPGAAGSQHSIRHHCSRHTAVHGILLEVLIERFGVKNLELDWFRSYHTRRTQTFRTPSGSSTSVALTCSVPQGSVIGLKKFIIYTEDIKETIDRFIINQHLYADDSQLLAHIKINTVMEHCRKLEICVESLQD